MEEIIHMAQVIWAFKLLDYLSIEILELPKYLPWFLPSF